MTEPYPLTNEQKILKETVGRMAQEKIRPHAAEIDETGEFPWDVHEYFKELGLFGLAIPEDYGGSDAGMLSAVLVLEEIGKVCSSSAIICAAPIVVGRIILESGHEEQKREHLPKIASGETIPAFALTESDAESEVARLTTRAERNEDHYIIRGSKCFIPLADVAGLMTVFAKTYSVSQPNSISVFIVERNSPGWSVSRIEKKMGTQAIHDCEVIFEGCVIPRANLLGKEGEGHLIAMKSLELGCLLTAARTLGLAQGALDYALKYTHERIQFGRSIASFQGIQFMLADMAMQIEAGRSLLYKAGAAMDGRESEGYLYGSMAKCFVTDMAMKVSMDAVQLLGGYGYMKDHPLERMMRDAKLTQLVDGTNQSRRLMIGREVLKKYKAIT